MGTFLPFLVLPPGPRICPTQSLGILSWLLVPDRNWINTRRVLGRSYSTCEVWGEFCGRPGKAGRWPKENFLPTQSCCQNHGGNELCFSFALKHEVKLENEHFLTTQSWYTQAVTSMLKSYVKLFRRSWLPVAPFGQKTVNEKEASVLCLVQNKSEIIPWSVI